MKKLILNGFLGLSLLFSACNPYEDIQEKASLINDGKSIPEFISLDNTYASIELAEKGLVDYMTTSYPEANMYTEGQITEIEYNLSIFNLAEYEVTEDDYILTENEYCTDVTRWHNESFKEISDTVKITLTDTDYDLVGNGKYKNFSSSDDKEGEYPYGTKVDNKLNAKVSHILLENYPDTDITGNTLVIVTYNYYSGGATEKARNYEYGMVPFCEYYFKSEDDINSKITIILNNLHLFEQDGAEVKVTYIVEETENNEFFLKLDGNWSLTQIADLKKDYYTLVDADYISMGIPADKDGKYSFSENNEPENYMVHYLDNKYLYPQKEEEHRIIYKYYESDKIAQYTYSIDGWMQTAPLETTSKEVSKFKYVDGKWVVSKATPVSLNTEDYTLTGDEKYENFGFWNNEPGEFPEGTAVDNLLVAKIQTILETNYTDLNEEDAEVVVSYKYFNNNSTNVQRLSLIFTEGVWVVTDSTIILKYE